MELNQCPFCGNEAVIEGIHEYDGDNCIHTYVITCTNEDCKAQIKSNGNIDETIKRWNTRSNRIKDVFDNSINKKQYRGTRCYNCRWGIIGLIPADRDLVWCRLMNNIFSSRSFCSYSEPR